MYTAFRRRKLASRKELARIRRVFDKFDKDRSGCISKSEIEEFVQEAQKYSTIYRKEIKSIFEEMDLDQDGRVTISEFQTSLQSRVSMDDPPPPSEEESLKLAFKRVDKDGNGQLSLGEVIDFMSEMGYPPIFARVLLDSMDSDRNQMITFEQFKEKLENNPISLLDSSLATLHRLFKIFDKDGSGFIEASDLTNYIEEAESASVFFGPAIRQAVALIDSNKDGKISFDEFAAYIKKSEPMAPSEEVWALEDRILEINDFGYLEVNKLAAVLIDEGYDPERFISQDDRAEITLADFMARMKEKPLTLKEASVANLTRITRDLCTKPDGAILLSSLHRQLGDDERSCDWFLSAMSRAMKSILADNNSTSFENTSVSFDQIQNGLQKTIQSQSLVV